jgi:putative ABC transport system ATP-binding protein
MAIMNEQTVADVEQLGKVYGDGGAAVVALAGVSAGFRRGEFTAIMGPSGSGKSTFMHCLAGLDKPTTGKARIAGIDLGSLDDEKLTRVRREKIGFVFQSFNLIPDLDVYDNIDVPLRYRGQPIAERRRRIDEALARVGLSSRARHYPAEMSGGQQQRVAIARALVGEPRLLLADEPTGNLDTQMARGVMELLEDTHRRGATIVMVTHDPDLAARAQRVVYITDGQIVALGSPTHLVTGVHGSGLAAQP